uniref:Iron-sulfur cluster formation ABC transporterATP-binding subunit n=1 Tax=Osmundaria fimbriata TaxID=228265 RepID=A0A1Z1M3Z9_OSMFI|nr:Iron-sulfur cluster formation ABC transporterATP-binding subunit [Osmundaria fimbriata]ARW60817.1 Iron-sulfur cluster formation ABC transporterATP-binding subunit [Osmundaria fimbriata]
MTINKKILEIKDLYASVQGKNILNGLNLSIKQGEIHALMGKNGSGKSTLAKVIAGHPYYEIKKGQIIMNEEDITNEEPDIRSHKGIFLGFQYPIEIPGVSNIDFLRLAYNSKQKVIQEKELDPLSFFDLINKKLDQINMNNLFLDRYVNEGFSGGEKKKNEILQMFVLNKKLSILDEIDSGLDMDALKSIANNIKSFSNNENAVLLITHYQRLIDYVMPNYVHVMDQGKIIYTGDQSTAAYIEKYGYNYIKQN